MGFALIFCPTRVCSFIAVCERKIERVFKESRILVLLGTTRCLKSDLQSMLWATSPCHMYAVSAAAPSQTETMWRLKGAECFVDTGSSSLSLSKGTCQETVNHCDANQRPWALYRCKGPDTWLPSSSPSIVKGHDLNSHIPQEHSTLALQGPCSSCRYKCAWRDRAQRQAGQVWEWEAGSESRLCGERGV